MLDKENRFNRMSCVCIIRTVGPTGVKKALQPTGQHIIIHRLNKSKRRRERLAQRFPTVSKGSQRLSKPFEKGNVALELRLRAVAFYRCTPVSLLWPGSEQLWCTLSAVLHHFFILTHSFLFSFFFFQVFFNVSPCWHIALHCQLTLILHRVLIALIRWNFCACPISK